MTTPRDAEIDWNLTTWKGARRKQHQEFHAIPFSRKLEIIEEMNRAGLATMASLQKRGLPYIDPYTGERVAGARVQEAPGMMMAETFRPRNEPLTSPHSWIAPRVQIEDFARRVAEEFQPERIILFGSHAYGTPTEDSDVDLLVVMPHEGRSHEQATRIRDRVEPHFAMDLLVRDPQVMRQRLEWNDFFLLEIVAKGITLYESSDARVDRKS